MSEEKMGEKISKQTIIGLSLPGKKYDSTCKELFQNKEIIAPVLKAVVPEYKNSTVEEIIKYIDADSIKDIPVDAVSQRVTGLPTEMSSVSDKLIYFDTHFTAVNPKLTNEQICIHLHFDLEIQNDYRPTNPKYPIVKRGIYYAAREISYQLGILTEQTNYADIQKVYSIWICNENVPKNLQNTVTMYSVKREDIIGTTDEPEADYDLMSVIIIRRGETDDGRRNYEPIFDYLSGIFECDTMRVCKYVDISQNEAIKKGMADMKGLGQSIADKNLKKGIRQGKASDIIELLSELETVPETLCDEIYAQEDLTILKRWLKIAAKAENVSDFVDKM